MAFVLEENKPRFVLEPSPETFDPTEGMSSYDKFMAGAGKGMYDLARGAGQMLGVTSPADVAESRRLDAPLMDTGAGQVGNFVGQAAALAPALLIPGVNTYAGATALGGATGALQPTTGDESRLSNVGIGAAGGLAGQKLGNVISNAIGKNVANAATQKAANVTRDATLKQSQDAGYKIPQSLYNPTFVGNRLESIAGKAAIKQQAAINNQQVTNSLARKYLGLAPDTPLDKASMEALRSTYADPYRVASKLPAGAIGSQQIKSLGTGSVSNQPVMKSGAQLVEAIKEARDTSRAAWRSFNAGMAQSPTKVRKEAIRADRMVSKLENELESLAQQNNLPDLVNELRNARVNIAKVHSIENALNEATGDVSSRTLMAQGKKAMLTGEAKKIADFAKAFPQVAQNGANIPAAGVSKVEAMMATLLAGGGGAMFGFPGMSAAALTAIPHMVRPLALSGGAPKYGSSVASMMSGKPAELLPYLGLLGGGTLASQ